MLVRAVFLLAFALSAFAGQAPQIASYDIDARLDTKAHAIHAREVLTWLNDSPDEVRELQFHLYMNAFRDEHSTFLREAGAGMRERLKQCNGWGWTDVKRLAIQGGPDLTRAIRYIHPDDDNDKDRTVMAVDLPQPVKPGATIRIEIDFYTQMPRKAGRTAWQDEYYFVAQWFPKIGVWEQAGERYSTKGQWNCHQYHSNGEFYSDFGRYDVRLTVPSNYVVGATGGDAARTDDRAAGTSTYSFIQDDVHDFAWTASPAFRRIERVFDPAREVSAKELADTSKLLGVAQQDLRLDPVKMILLIQPEHASQIDRHFRALANGLKHFGLWYGKYPYRTITCVDPAHRAGTGGMEYPTLITAGTSWLVSEDAMDPEMVTVHEFGHQYWYGMVANNEFEESWLDEGFNTYSTSRILDIAYPPVRVPVSLAGIPVSGLLNTPRVNWDSMNRLTYLLAPEADAIARRSWEFYDGMSYGLNSYSRTAVMLRTLEGVLGEQTMARILRTYFQRWKFKHPTTHDFIKVVNEVSGRDMTWFFDQFLFGSNVLDYAVGRVSSSRPDPKKSVWESTVSIRREGEAVLPIKVLIRLKNGKTIAKQWDGQYRWTKFRLNENSPVETVTVESGLLDVNFANNTWRMQPARAPILKWSANLVFWAQNFLLFLASLT